MPAKDVNFKTSFAEIPKRISVRGLRTNGILSFDLDNVYPQRTELLVKGSATGVASQDLFKKFIAGEGFRDVDFGTTVVNEDGETINEIETKIANDYAYHQGWALHFNVDVLGNIQEIQHVPFKFVRLPSVDNKQRQGQFAIYEDWDRQIHRSIKQDRIKWVDAYNSDPDAIQEQIEGEDGEKDPTTWNGQLFYWTANNGGYPEGSFDAALSDLETDQELALFRNSTVLTSFMASYAAKYKNEFEDDGERLKANETLLSMQGGRNAGKVATFEGMGEDENALVFEKLDTIDNQDIFSQTKNDTQENIRISVQAPSELIGREFSSGFDTNRIQEQRIYYNTLTVFERTNISMQFEKFIPNFIVDITPETYEIKPLYEDQLKAGEEENA